MWLRGFKHTSFARHPRVVHVVLEAAGHWCGRRVVRQTQPGEGLVQVFRAPQKQRRFLSSSPAPRFHHAIIQLSGSELSGRSPSIPSGVWGSPRQRYVPDAELSDSCVDALSEDTECGDGGGLSERSDCGGWSSELTLLGASEGADGASGGHCGKISSRTANRAGVTGITE